MVLILLARTILITGDKIDNYLHNEYIMNPIIDTILKNPIQLDKLLFEVNKQINSIRTLDMSQRKCSIK